MMQRCSSIATVRYILCIGLLLLLSQFATAQPVRQIETGFERDVNRYRWTSGVQVGIQLYGWDVAIANRFLSDAFILFDDRLNFRDEDHLRWRVSRPLGSRFSARLRGQAAWFSQSRAFSQEIYAGLRYQPRPFAWVEPALGVAWDRRPGAAEAVGEAPLRRDAGPAYGARFAMAPPPINAYRLRLSGDARWQQISPRRGRTVQFEGSAERLFETTRLNVRSRLASSRRDAYQAVSFLNRDGTTRRPESVEATTSDTLLTTIELDAPFYRGLRLSTRLDFEGTNRFIRTERAPNDALFFETNFARRALDAEAAVRYEHPRLNARMAVRGGAATERRELANREAIPTTEAVQKSTLLQQADYDEGTFTLLANLRTTPRRRLVLTFDGTASIVRHDTPDVNPDDRDEVFYTGQFGTLLRLSRYLQADVKLYGSFNHTVYINATRSAENNKQRALRLRPSLRWTPGTRTTVRFTPQIRATYTVDDFVLQGRRPTDQSAREVSYEADLEHSLSSGLRLQANGSYSDLRLGRLLWDDFAEIPFDTLRTYNGWMRIQSQVTGRLTAEIGARFFIRSDFERATTVRYPRVDENGLILRDEEGIVLLTSVTRPGRRLIEQVGPATAILWTMTGGSVLRVDGWLNIQHTRQRLYGDLPDAAAPRIRQAARDGARQIIPNLSLSAIWNF